MNKYILNTWFATNFLHPALVVIYFKWVDPAMVWSQAIAGYLYYTWLALATGLPCLFAGQLCFSMIARIPDTVRVRRMLWLMIWPSLTFVSAWVIVALPDPSAVEVSLLPVTITISALISVLIRQKQLRKAVSFKPKLVI